MERKMIATNLQIKKPFIQRIVRTAIFGTVLLSGPMGSGKEDHKKDNHASATVRKPEQNSIQCVLQSCSQGQFYPIGLGASGLM